MRKSLLSLVVFAGLAALSLGAHASTFNPIDVPVAAVAPAATSTAKAGHGKAMAATVAATTNDAMHVQAREQTARPAAERREWIAAVMRPVSVKSMQGTQADRVDSTRRWMQGIRT